MGVAFQFLIIAKSAFRLIIQPPRRFQPSVGFLCGHCNSKAKANSEASPPSRAGLPGKEDCHFCIAPLDPALPDEACGEQAGQ